MNAIIISPEISDYARKMIVKGDVVAGVRLNNGQWEPVIRQCKNGKVRGMVWCSNQSVPDLHLAKFRAEQIIKLVMEGQ